MFSALQHRPWLASSLLAALLLLLSFIALLIGPAGLSTHILWLSRLPRLLALLCAGAGMAAAGLIMQQLCANKFMSPTTGATIQCSQLGILLASAWLPQLGLWGRIGLAFGAALAGTGLFVGMISRIRFKDPILVPLCGMMFGNVVGGLTTFAAYELQVTQQLSAFMTGSFALITKGNYELVWICVPLIILAFFYASHFNIVGMGRSFAANLGVNYRVVLMLGLSLCALITASITAVSGPVSFIGLLIPNMVTMIKGDNLRNTLLDTVLAGAAFLVACDIIARLIIAPYELPVDLIIGIIGSLVFIGLLIIRLNPQYRQLAKGNA